MARYRKVDPRIWNDEKFLSLSDDGKLVFLFVLTHPHLTALGAMRATIPGLASELRWPVKRLRKGLGEPFRKGLLEHDETASFIALPNYLKYNKPDNPNIVKSWADWLDLLPECELKNRLVSRCCDIVETLSDAFVDALPKPFREPFRNGMPNHEHEHKQEQEHKHKHKDRGGDRDYSEQFLRFWEIFPPVRKGSKPVAWDAWQKAIARKPPEDILAAVAEFAASELAKSEYCPGPAPWLNRDRWDDDRRSWKRDSSQSTKKPSAFDFLKTEEASAN